MARGNSDIGSLILRSASRARAKTATALERKTTEVISSNGYFSGFPGDIVDTGALRASKEVTVSGPYVRILRYGGTAAPYALFVHEGYTLRNGQEQPGRPWITRAAEDLDINATFTEFFEQKLEELT